MAMIDVFVRPPSESCRILVSFDSLEEKNTFVKKARVSPSYSGHTPAGTTGSKYVSVPVSKGHFRRSLHRFWVLLGSLSTVQHLDRPPAFVREGSHLYGM